MNNGGTTVVHLTTSHSIDDARVVVKECATLAAAGYDVRLVGAGLPAGKRGGITVTGIRPAKNRWHRVLLMPIRLWRAAKALEPSIVHLHEPELLVLVPLWRATGTTVVYDSHEDLPRLLRGRLSIPRPLRRPVALLASHAERVAARHTTVISAEPGGARRFTDGGIDVTLVQNYPIIEEFAADPTRTEFATICYVGGLTRERGAIEMVEAIGLVPSHHNPRLRLAGTVRGDSLVEEMRSTSGWSRVELMGWLDRQRVSDVLQTAQVGLVVLHPIEQYRESTQPVKLFEYMAAGVPVVASDFPAWRTILETDDGPAGILVDPLDPEAIAAAITELLDKPVLADAMGQRGRRAVQQDRRWETEGRRLVRLYESILDPV